MAIIHGPKTIDEKEMLKSVENFSCDNSLTEEEKDELAFICKSFVKFYNTMSTKSNSYSPKMIAEAFDEMLKNSILKDRWSGLTTRANLFYKQVPELSKVLSNDTLDNILCNNTLIRKEPQPDMKDIRREIKKEFSNKGYEERISKLEKASKQSTISTGGYCSGGGRSSGPSC